MSVKASKCDFLFPFASVGVYNLSAPLEYNVLLNAGTERPLVRPAGPEHFMLLQGLDPYTIYHIQVQACQPGILLPNETWTL